jgi:hypothetical protein
MVLWSSPVGRWPLYQLQTGEPFDMLAWYNLVGGVGALLWLLAYLRIIWLCHKQRTYGVPLVAVCLNFTWELMDSFFLPDPVPLWRLIDRSWLLVDVAIVTQLLLFGRKEQLIDEIRRWFVPVVLAILALAFFGQYAWVTTFHDTLGIALAFAINLVMSALFIPFFFARRASGRGLSLSVGWLKLFGTLLSSVQCYFLLPIIHPVSPSTTHLGTYSFFHFLFVGCFLLDGLYVVLLTRARSSTNRPAA